MRESLIVISLLVAIAFYAYSVVRFLDYNTPYKELGKYRLMLIISAISIVVLPLTMMAITAPATNATLMDKTFAPSGYIYNWDARQLEQRIERRETRYYFIVRKNDGRIVEERVDSATYVKTDVGERILVD